MAAWPNGQPPKPSPDLCSNKRLRFNVKEDFESLMPSHSFLTPCQIQYGFIINWSCKWENKLGLQIKTRKGDLLVGLPQMLRKGVKSIRRQHDYSSFIHQNSPSTLFEM